MASTSLCLAEKLTLQPYKRWTEEHPEKDKGCKGGSVGTHKGL